MSEEIKLPHYEDLIVKGVHEMGIKFANYGNDWVTKDSVYWKERILKEVKEYRESMTVDSEKRKLINILNMIAMAYETVENRGCIQHIAEYKYIMMSEHSNIKSKCIHCDKDLIICEGIIREANKIE